MKITFDPGSDTPKLQLDARDYEEGHTLVVDIAPSLDELAAAHTAIGAELVRLGRAVPGHDLVEGEAPKPGVAPVSEDDEALPIAQSLQGIAESLARLSDFVISRYPLIHFPLPDAGSLAGEASAEPAPRKKKGKAAKPPKAKGKGKAKR